MHKLAIVIPYYKIDHFEDTLRSLRLQTNSNFSLYIGNDASADSPLPVLERIFASGEYKYFEYHNNLGSINLALQWERILGEVTEEWIQILGDDDFVSLNFVEEFYRNIIQLPSFINLIKFKSILCDGDGKITKQLYEGFSTGRYHIVDFIIQKFGGRLNSSLSEHIFKKLRYDEVGFADYALAWHTDDRFILEASNYQTFFFIAEAKVFVRVYEGSTSGAKDNITQKRAASIKFFNDLAEILSERGFSWSRRRAFLKSLRKNKAYLGNENLAKIYYRNGVRGRFYYAFYLFKLSVKKLLPHRILRKFQP